MFLNPAKFLFFIILMSSTLMSVSSTSWFGAWMGLEINLLSFIPLMSNGMNQRSTEASLKYFLTQALGSILLISSAALLLFSPNFQMTFFSNNFLIILINSALLLKMGAAPFHFWFPEVLGGLSWLNTLILMTWQKLAPLGLISYTVGAFSPLIFIVIMLSAILGALGGLNQTSLRKVMAFSSINHLSWIISAMLASQSLWLFYFLMYTILSLTVIMFFFSFNIFHLIQIFDMTANNTTTKFSFIFALLSLGGLPPFTGFIPKWMVIQVMMENKSIFSLFILVMAALVTLFFYLRLVYLSMTVSSTTKLWAFKIPSGSFNPNVSMFFISTSLLGFPALIFAMTIL